MRPSTAPALTIGDVAKYAKPNCRDCYGRGFIKVERSGDLTGKHEPCGCARLRYLKAQRATAQ